MGGGIAATTETDPHSQLKVELSCDLVIFIFQGILQGMMMGLGKRSAGSFYQNRKKDVRTAEFVKRNDYLEDTGMFHISRLARLMMGLISRSHVGFRQKKSK